MEYVGRKVKKGFEGCEILTGIVRSYDSGRGYFKIEYEDGNSEELDLSEMISRLHDGIGDDDDGQGQGQQLYADHDDLGKANKRRRIGYSSQAGNGNDCLISSNSSSSKNGLGGELDLNAGGGLDLNVNFNLNEGLDLNCVGNEGLDLNRGVVHDDDDSNFSVEGKLGKSRGEIIDLNLDVNENEHENLNLNLNDDLKEYGNLTERKGHCFDLNLGLEEESKGFLAGDSEGQFKESTCEVARKDEPKEEEGNCGSEASEVAHFQNVEENQYSCPPENKLTEINPVDIELKSPLENDGCSTGFGSNTDVVSESAPKKRRGRKRKVPLDTGTNPATENELTEINPVEIELNGPLDNEGSSTWFGSNTDVVSESTPKRRRGRKRKMPLDTETNPVTETVLRRSTRRARKADLLEQDTVSSTAVVSDAVNDLSSSSAISAVTEEKITEVVGQEGSEERNVLPPKLELPPCSRNLNLEGMPVLDVFFVYSFLRSFSTLLFLSPFELEDFVVCMNSNAPTLLFDSIHVSLLHTLRKHLESLSEESSQSASNCLRSLNWDFLDMITWPIFMVEYLLLHSSGLKPGFEFGHLKLFERDYYKQSSSVKIEILRCLCDDVIEVESIKSELNRRTLATEPSLDFDQNMKSASTRKRKALVDVAGNSCVTEEDNDETLDWNSDECCLCKMDGSLICCDGCPAAFHSRCVGVVSNHLPEGDWYCPECVIDKYRPWMKVGKSIRGADLLGIDPYGQLYYSCCGYLLVLDDCHSETSFKYYVRNDLPAVIEALRSSEIIYYAIISAILKRWDLSFEVDGAKEELGSQQFVAVSWERQIPATSAQLSTRSETLFKDVILDEGRAVDKSLVSVSELVNVKSGIVDHAVNVGNQVLSSEESAEVSQAVPSTHNLEKTRFGLRRRSCVSDKSETPGKLARDYSLGSIPSAGKIIDSAKQGHISSVVEAKILSQGSCGTGYMNYYTFARTASSIAEDLTTKSSNKNSVDALKSVDAIISDQMKSISDKFTEFCWPNVLNTNLDARREKCGWCFSCRFPEDERECLVSMYCYGPALEKFTTEVLGIRSRKSKTSHLVDVVCHILCTEDRLQGLLLGPWLNPQYSKFWRKSALRVAGIASVKSLLLKLESNLRHLALSADWTKHVDSAVTIGSAVHVITSSGRGSSRNGTGRKRAKGPETEATTSSNAASGLGLFWWRGGRLSRQLFDWKVLPRSLVSKAARQAGCKKISGILYPDASEFAKRSKYIAWRAAVESSKSVEQLALQVRELDANIRWDDIDNTNLSLKLEKESKKPIRSFKKVIVRRKCSQGTDVKYLLDFGKRRFIPDIVVRHGSNVEECSSERKKYWLEESYVPLHLLKAYEQKRIARKSNKMSSGKLQESIRVVKQPLKKKGFSYLFSKAERSENYQCGHCNKDVLIREAVSCQYCRGFFHKRHVRKSAGAITSEFKYTCHKCQEGKYMKTDAKKEKLGLQKSKKSSKQLRPLHSKIGKQAVREKQLKQMQKNKKGPVVIPLRRSPRMAKCVLLQNKKIRAHKRMKQSKSTKVASKKQLKSTQKKRTQCYPIYWRNGLHLSKKPNDERLLHFKSKELLVLCGESTTMVQKPRCSLCCELEFSSMLNYVACELCGDWFHGDALDLKMEEIARLIGFKCHKCLRRNPPCCPHLDATRTEGAKLVELNNTERIDSVHEKSNAPAFSSEALVEQDFQLSEESKRLSLTGDDDERKELGTTFGSNEMHKSAAENGQLPPCSVQTEEAAESSMASKEEHVLQKDEINMDELPQKLTAPAETESRLSKAMEVVSENKTFTSSVDNHLKNGLVNQ